MKIPEMTKGEFPCPTTPWLTQFRESWHSATPKEQEQLKSDLIGKLSGVKDDWFELIEAAKIVEATRKQNKSQGY